MLFCSQYLCTRQLSSTSYVAISRGRLTAGQPRATAVGMLSHTISHSISVSVFVCIYECVLFFLLRCFLPPSVALALRHSPELVSTAVRFYCSGDPTDRKAGVRMTRLLPRPATDRSLCGTSDSSSTSMNDSTGEPVASRFVEFRVTFTRHLYAQLHQAPVVPAPKVFPAT